MKSYSESEIAGFIHGTFVKKANIDYMISNILIDSRMELTGADVVFFAIKGERHNGHNYIKDLINRGVRVFVVSEIRKEFLNSNIATFIKVKDTLLALHQLVINHRKHFDLPVIGITGSNGKTIVKEWLYDILKDYLSIVRSPRSYNSQVGVPLSVWLLEEHYGLAIFEAGISFPGEMGKIEKLIKPDIGIFTNIGSAHQENFKDFEQKIEEKLNLFSKSKKIIYSADQGILTERIDKFCREKLIEKFNWSIKGNPALIQFQLTIKEFKTYIQSFFNSKEYKFSIPFNDKSSIENVCHCFVAIVSLGLDPEIFLSQFNELNPVAMRLEIKHGNRNSIIINDYYNSDINSLSIALNVLNSQSETGNFDKVVILSDIKQSGIPVENLYKNVNQMFKQAKISNFIGIGSDIKSQQNVFETKNIMYDSTDEFLKNINNYSYENKAILLKGAREFNFELISTRLENKSHQTIFEVNLNALVENLNTFRSILKPSTKIMAMVKAFSYGSGLIEIAKLLQYHHVDYLAVAVADEGLELRQNGINTPIVVMNPESHSFQNMIDFRLEPSFYSLDLLNDFINVLRYNAEIEFPIHIKIDTGMNRLGFKYPYEIKELTSILQKTKEVKIVSVFSHLASSDEPQYDSFTIEQCQNFESLSSIILSGFSYKIIRHILNSSGIERFSQYQFDMARLGIGLYGISCNNLKLKDIGVFKTKISQIKEVGEKETIGYSRKGKVKKPSQIAIIPIGYADGLPRILGNLNGEVYVNGTKVPIIGNICMDMCMIDVTGIEVNTGDEVEIFGNHIDVKEIAKKANTIPYEILTNISQRVKRVYLQE